MGGHACRWCCWFKCVHLVAALDAVHGDVAARARLRVHLDQHLPSKPSSPHTPIHQLPHDQGGHGLTRCHQVWPRAEYLWVMQDQGCKHDVSAWIAKPYRSLPPRLTSLALLLSMSG